MLKAVVLANWGLGLEVLKTLHTLPSIEIALVVTRYNASSCDPWYNVVYNFAAEQDYSIRQEQALLLDELQEYIVMAKIDLMICHAFMRMLPEKVFSAPKYGSINIHASLLPNYRGPSPTYWVLKNKEKITGLTCHYIDQGVDTGDIIYQVEVPVEPNDTIETIIEKQKTSVGLLITESLVRIIDENFRPIRQNDEIASYAPRPK